MRIHSRSLAKLGPAISLTLAVVACYGYQIWQATETAERRIGFWMEADGPGIEVAGVSDGQPAAAAGIREGDRILAIDGTAVDTLVDYDLAARSFTRDVPLDLRVLRDGDERTVVVHPGTAVEWRPLVFDGVLVACYLALALLALGQRAGDMRARLLFLLCVLVALEIAEPDFLIGAPRASEVLFAVFYLLTGGQMAVELHLASIIPDRPRWLERRPWVVPLYYVVGLGLAVVAFATYVLEVRGRGELLPWTSADTDVLVFSVGLPLWAGLLVVLLGRTAMRHPEPRGRHQAGLVLLAVLPWCLYVYSGIIVRGLAAMGRVLGGLAEWPLFAAMATLETPSWIESLLPWILLVYPLAVFVAIFRYHLFDLEVVVRRSLVYTVLTTLLLLVFYGALGAGGALLSQWVDAEAQSIWVVSAATLLLGLLFAPLRRTVQGQIDRRFFPERGVLRQRLVDLAAELPALGKVQRMGQHLTESLCELFGVRWATLILADPRSGMLWTAAGATRNDSAEEPLVSLLVSPDDPAVLDLLEHARPLRAERIDAHGSTLQPRLAAADAETLVPLASSGRLVGILVLGRRPWRRLRAEEIELLNLLAQHVGTVLENVRLFESATYESLTGLLRREAVHEELEREVERARRYDRPLTVGLADLDHFKAINDRYGHLAGDALLRRVAQELASGLRSTDVIGRWGGEEFLLVFPETDVAGAARVAEKVRSRLEALAVELEDGSVLGVRVSIGLAALHEVAEASDPARALIAAADEALYRAKDAGRNRVEPPLAAAGGHGRLLG